MLQLHRSRLPCSRITLQPRSTGQWEHNAPGVRASGGEKLLHRIFTQIYYVSCSSTIVDAVKDKVWIFLAAKRFKRIPQRAETETIVLFSIALIVLGYPGADRPAKK